HRLEVDQRAEPDPADFAHRAHVRDADDDGGEDDRRDEHLHQLDEAVAERPHRGAFRRRHDAEKDAGRDADEDLHVEAREDARYSHERLEQYTEPWTFASSRSSRP